MAFRPAPQGNPHGLSRVRAVGSPFEVSNNLTRIPQTLNYVDCYPMKEDQFGEDPLYAVTCREAFKILAGQSYDLSTITISGSGATASPPNNASAAPSSLSGYKVSQIGQLLLIDDSSTNVGGTQLFTNVLMYNAANAGTQNAYVIVSLILTIGGTTGTTVTVSPKFLWFDLGPTIGAAAVANNSIQGVTGAFIDPYYLLYSAPAALALTVPNGSTSYNIYTAAVAAGMTSARSITVTVTTGYVVGPITTGSGFYPGTTITIVNNGTIYGNGGAGGAGGSSASPQGGNGTQGGAAITLQWPITLTNTSGVISGGGGGGGGGAFIGGRSINYGGGGGGGGQGFTGGAAGASGGNGGVAGNAGTNTSGGAGGIGGGSPGSAGTAGSGYLSTGNAGAAPVWNGRSTPVGGGSGGGGGGFAGAGGSSGTGTYGGIGGTAGSAGYAVQCNSYPIYNIPNGNYTGAGTYGTIYGSIG